MSSAFFIELLASRWCLLVPECEKLSQLTTIPEALHVRNVQTRERTRGCLKQRLAEDAGLVESRKEEEITLLSGVHAMLGLDCGCSMQPAFCS